MEQGKSDYKGKRNYRGKKKDSDKNGSPRKQSNPSPAIPNSGLPRLGLVHGSQVQGASNNSVLASVYDLTLDLSQIVDTAFAMTSSDIQSVIDSYASARGYTSSLTSTNVKDYLKYAIQYFANLVATFRAENCRLAVNQSGNVVGPLFNDIVTEMLPLEPFGTNTLAVYNSSSISNAVWAADYLSGLNLTKIPEAIVGLILQLFGVFYSTNPYSDLGNNACISLKPSLLVRSGCTTAMASMKALVTAQPDLLPILGILGINGDAVNAIDFQRDLKGQTLPVVVSPDMLHMFANAQILSPLILSSRTETMSLYIDYTSDETSMFSHPILADTGDDAILPLLLRNVFSASVLSSNRIVKVILESAPNNVVMYNVIPPGFLISGGGNWQASASLINNAQERWAECLGIPTMASYTYTITEALGITSLSVAEATVTPEGSSAYYFNSNEFVVYSRVAANILIFGASWRNDLTSLIRDMSTRVSNIKY